MKYEKHYNRLMERARNRTLSGYCERHHIIPRCMQGDDSLTNLVDLTPEEHYVAHQLLVKIHPGNKKLVRAAHRMTSGKYRTNRLYGWVRRLYAQTMIGNQRAKGLKQTEEHKRKNAEAKLGEKNPMYGKPSRLKGIKTGRVTSSCFKKGHIPWNTGKTIPAETKMKLSLAHQKPVMIDGIVYPSRSIAAKQLNVSRNVIHRKLNSGKAINLAQ